MKSISIPTLAAMLCILAFPVFSGEGTARITKVSRVDLKHLVPQGPEEADRAADTYNIGVLDSTLLPVNEQGEKFLVHWWCSHAPRQEAVVRMEYLTQKSPVLFTAEQPVSLHWGGQTVTFRNTGREYRDRGRIQLWRVSLLAGDKVIAEKHSALWDSLPETIYQRGQI